MTDIGVSLGNHLGGLQDCRIAGADSSATNHAHGDHCDDHGPVEIVQARAA
jgi:hypothetical protein